MRNKLQRLVLLATTTVLAVGAASQANGQQSTDPVAAAQQQVANQAALEKAVNDLAAQRAQALGLANEATGTTDLGERGGQFEGWLLSANAIDFAADQIKNDLGTSAGTIVLLQGDEAFDLALPQTMGMRLDALAFRLRQASGAAQCPGSNPGGPQPMALPGGIAALLPYVGQVIGAFRTDTTITGYQGPTDAALIINALARQRPPEGQRWIIPTAISQIPPTSELLTKWNAVNTARVALAACRGTIPATEAARIAIVDQALAEVNAFETRDIAGGTGASPFVQAMRLAGLAGDQNLRVVRVYVSQAGGSVIERQNLFTTLGLTSGVSVTGGAVVGWRMVYATDGRIAGGGNLVCLTDHTSLGSIQRGRFRTPNCRYQHSARRQSR